MGGDHTHPLAVDGHLHVRIDPKFGDLGDVADPLHVRGVAAGTEDASDSRLGVHVVRRNERPRRVARKGDNFRGYRLYSCTSSVYLPTC